jgi:hypothetical protein
MPFDTTTQTDTVTIPFEAEIVFSDGEFDRIDLVTFEGRGVQKRTVLGWGDLSPKIRERLLQKFASEIEAGR